MKGISLKLGDDLGANTQEETQRTTNNKTNIRQEDPPPRFASFSPPFPLFPPFFFPHICTFSLFRFSSSLFLLKKESANMPHNHRTTDERKGRKPILSNPTLSRIQLHKIRKDGAPLRPPFLPQVLLFYPYPTLKRNRNLFAVFFRLSLSLSLSLYVCSYPCAPTRGSGLSGWRREQQATTTKKRKTKNNNNNKGE